MLIVKLNMSMPESCHECSFAKWEYDYCYCSLRQKGHNDTNALAFKRPRFCPLKEEKASG